MLRGATAALCCCTSHRGVSRCSLGYEQYDTRLPCLQCPGTCPSTWPRPVGGLGSLAASHTSHWVSLANALAEQRTDFPPQARRSCLLSPRALLLLLGGAKWVDSGGMTSLSHDQSNLQPDGALQLLIRRMINVAYLDPTESGSYDLPDFEKRRLVIPSSRRT
jgi:hypothetical protein